MVDATGGNHTAFVWDSSTRTMRNLNDVTVTPNLPAGWVLEEATGVNAAGQITGNGVYQGVGHPFVLVPSS